MAAIMIVLPRRSSRSSNCGMVVISIDVSFMAVWPSARRFSAVRALRRCSAAFPFGRSWDRRWVVPSIIITSKCAGWMACTCQQAPLERFRVDPRARPTKGIVCGDAIRQRQKRGEPHWFAAARFCHSNPTVCPAGDYAHSNNDNINQVMRLGASARGSSAVAKYWVIASCGCSVVAPSAIRHERGAMMPENARNRN